MKESDDEERADADDQSGEIEPTHVVRWC
jgi:hypothetical protein